MDEKKLNEMLRVESQILARLNILISLVSDHAVPIKERPSLRERIERFSTLGISPTEISEILGTTSNFVNKELSVIRKSRRLRKRKGGKNGQRPND